MRVANALAMSAGMIVGLSRSAASMLLPTFTADSWSSCCLRSLILALSASNVGALGGRKCSGSRTLLSAQWALSHKGGSRTSMLGAPGSLFIMEWYHCGLVLLGFIHNVRSHVSWFVSPGVIAGAAAALR